MADDMAMEKYSGLAQLLHWLISALIVAQFALVWSAEALPRGDTQTTLMLSHKSVGMTVLLLAIVRLAWRFLHKPPAFPATMSEGEKWLARLTHWALYLLIFIMPLSGWLMSSTGGRSVQWFWTFTFPDLMAKNEALHEAFEETHEILAWTLLVLASFHVLAAIWHMVVKKDGLLRRMLP